jgi:hypothetical protein
MNAYDAMTRYILITDHAGDNVQAYTSAEMQELYTPQENHELGFGRVVTKGLALHVDMVAVAREAAHQELCNA